MATPSRFKVEAMLRVTNKAQAVLNEEMANYEAFLMNRATVYAEQDNSVEIKDKHINRAIKDYRNDYYYVSREMSKIKEHRKDQYSMFFFAIICLTLFVLIILLYIQQESITNTVEVISSLGVLAALILVITIYVSMRRRRNAGLENENQGKIIAFLNKWNEFESLLRVLYKKDNNKDPKTFRDLLLFYQQLPIVDNDGNLDSLQRLLNSRNNILHRSIKDVNAKTIDGLIQETDEIINRLKTLE